MSRKHKLPTLDQVARMVTGGATTIAQSMKKPDDDWGPTLFMFSQNKPPAIVSLAVAVEDKNAVPRVVVSLFRDYNPQVAALVVSCWCVEAKQDDPLADLTVDLCGVYGVRNHPHAREILQVQVEDAHGQQQRFEASITRRPGLPPLLGNWRREDFEAEGNARFNHLLRHAFAASDKKRNRQR